MQTNKKVEIRMQVPKDLKDEVKKILAKHELTFSTATELFLMEVIRHGTIPFDIGIDQFLSKENQEQLMKSKRELENGETATIEK